MAMTSQFGDMASSSNIFDVAVFLLSSLVTGPSFMSILLMVLELQWTLYLEIARDREISSSHYVNFPEHKFD